MRIIAGSARSLPLKAPVGKVTRPTTDRVKETLFNMLMPYVSAARFLDLFSGSGSIGLEALSRGASQAVFVENNNKAADCIRENIKFTKFDSQSILFQMDVSNALKKMEGSYTFDIVFMDPPYEQKFELEALRFLSHSSLIHQDTILVVEASVQTDFTDLAALGYHKTKEKKYKTNVHLFLQRT
jgi:16S rRNA (guanine966-N2)-methyltransferase